MNTGARIEPPRELGRPAWFAPVVAAVLYFSQGFPFGIVSELLPLYLRVQNVSLTQIGLISAVSSAWTWKFLWSPLVDRYGSYRRWMAGALVVLAATMAAFAVVPPHLTTPFFAIVALLAFASATQDIAIDAMAVRITPQRQLGYVNSIRVTAYRGAMIVAGGALAALTVVAGWRGAFLTAAAVMALVFLITFFLPREAGEGRHHPSPFSGIRKWMQQRYAIVFLLLAFIYRLGDAALFPMVKPFWVDQGFSTAEIGVVTTVVGLSFLIAGAFAGGAVVAHFGIWHALLWLGILQVASNAGYAMAASTRPTDGMFYTVVIVENFTSGLGTAAFLSFLMAICDREFAATQYALLSAAFAFTRFVIGSFSGLLAQNLGYTSYFWLTLVLGLPGLLLVPLIRNAELIAPRTREIVAET